MTSDDIGRAALERLLAEHDAAWQRKVAAADARAAKATACAREDRATVTLISEVLDAHTAGRMDADMALSSIAEFVRIAREDQQRVPRLARKWGGGNPRRFTDDDLRRVHATGVVASEASRQLGAEITTVRAHARRLGLRFPDPRTSTATRDALIAALAAGRSIDDIAAEHHMTPISLRTRLSGLGIRVRDHRPKKAR